MSGEAVREVPGLFRLYRDGSGWQFHAWGPDVTVWLVRYGRRVNVGWHDHEGLEHWTLGLWGGYVEQTDDGLRQVRAPWLRRLPDRHRLRGRWVSVMLRTG